MQNTMECMERNNRKILQKFDKEILRALWMAIMKWEIKGLEYSLVDPIDRNRDFYITFYSMNRRIFCFSLLILPDSNAQQIITTYIFFLPLHTKGGTYPNMIGENKFIRR